MQTHQIKNHMMSLTVAEHGAEITSIQLEGIERMWDADPAFWGRTAPVLFPIVGALKDNSYRYEGQTYLMGQHGFARDMDFTLTDQTEDKLEFTLFDNEETYEKYPFHFQLQIIYEVFQNQCRVTWKVKNMDDKTMYFQIGGHPAFACPCEGGMIRDDYSVRAGESFCEKRILPKGSIWNWRKRSFRFVSRITGGVFCILIIKQQKSLGVKKFICRFPFCRKCGKRERRNGLPRWERRFIR